MLEKKTAIFTIGGVHEVEAWQKKKMKKRKISLNHARSG